MKKLLLPRLLALIALLGAFSCATAKENEDWALVLEDERRMWMSFEVGATMPVDSSEIHTGVIPTGSGDQVDTYASSPRDGNLLLGAMLGYEWACVFNCDGKLFPSARLGIGYEYLTSSDIKGDINKDHGDTYHKYEYHIFSNIIWLDAQLDLFRNFSYSYFVPYIDIGVGAAFNTSDGYQEYPATDGTSIRTSADFKNHTTTSVAWRAGIGIDYRSPQFEHWALGLIVRYSNLGEAKTGDSDTYPTIGSLDTTLQNVEYLFSLRYTF